jgi:putative phosphoribosyl transferase
MAIDRFRDREEAGRKLAEKLSQLRGEPNTVVLGLPRGGVPVAFQIGEQLDLPLDVIVIRKIGAPGRKELALGAVGSGGTRVLNENVVTALGVDQATIDSITKDELREVERRENSYREGMAQIDVKNKHAVLVDDGLATGASMRAAVELVRTLEPRMITVAVPTGSPEAVESLEALADRVIALIAPTGFTAVGAWYQRFDQTSDQEVRRLLRRAREGDR